jgi:YfiH family protein
MNNVKFYTEKSFAAPDDDRISYGFFTHKGGISDGVYSGLNCGTGSGDRAENIIENRSRVAQAMGANAANLLSVYQVHGANAEYVDAPWLDASRPHADAMVTDKAEMALGILTADCAPVLFHGSKTTGKPVIGAAHAGWKGAIGGVLENVVSKMVALGADANTIHACVGPCISKSAYEVSVDFITPFIEENEESERFFYAGAKEGHAFFDLAGYCGWRLFRAGVKNVTLMDIDTYSLHDEFYSYRRTTHKKESDYGRQISVIMIK